MAVLEVRSRRLSGRIPHPEPASSEFPDLSSTMIHNDENIKCKAYTLHYRLEIKPKNPRLAVHMTTENAKTEEVVFT